MLKRNREIVLWLTDDELKHLKAQAKRCGLSQQAFLRSTINNINIKEQPSADFIAILKALEKIGDNINQIAAKANALGFIDKVQYRKDAEKLEKVVAELVRVAYT